MPSFAYVAKDRAGQLQKGLTEAATMAVAVDELRSRGWLVIDVSAASSSSVSSFMESLSPSSWLPVRGLDVAVGFQQLAVMLRSGLTLLSSLKVVSEHARRRRLGRIWAEVADRVQEGSSFADALAEYPCFSKLSVQLVRVGEQTGGLEQVLRRASQAIESQRSLRGRVLSALLYPCIVLVMTFGVTAYMIFSLIPKLERFLSQLGRRLPPMTQLLIDISHFSRDYVLQGSIIAAASVAAVLLTYTWPPGKLFIDRVLLRLPVVGTILRLGGTVLMSRSLELLLNSGITLLEALCSIEQLLPNAFLASCIANARERVLQGSDLSQPLLVKGGFEPLLPKMIAVGEQSGNLEEVLEEVSEFYEKELDTYVKRLGVIIEPLIIIFVGGVVGFVYIATFMALYSAV